MSEKEIWTPQKAAIRLTKICDTFSEIHGTERFPVNVGELSLGQQSYSNGLTL